MADVDRDRGQLILVTALTLAVLFVALALLLNTAIYTENVATRSSDPGTRAAIDYHEAVVSGTGGLVESTNDNHDQTYATLHSNLSEGLGNWSGSVAVHEAYRGHVTNVSLDGTPTNGTRIAQTEASGEFSNRTGIDDWTVVANTPRVRAFRMNVSQSDLTDTGGAGGLVAALGLGTDVFYVEFHDGSDTRRVYLYREGGLVRLRVEDSGGTFSSECTAAAGPDGYVELDITDAKMGGDECDPLDFFDAFSGPVTVRYEDGDAVAGTYRLVVPQDQATVNASGDYYDADVSSGSPFVTEAIYAADVSLTYESPDVAYNATVRVAPGDPT
ncbi:MAG: DUF7261 family protein [Halobacteriota archaeon]